MSSTLHFFGGAGEVTGSNFLLESEKAKIMVDCGLFQSAHVCEETNWSVFPYDPKSIDVLLVTHAHIDHIGRVPRLVKEGFAGKIISTEATKALAEPLLMDSMEILLSEAHRCGKEPLYTKEDVERSFAQWEGIPYRQTVELLDGFSFEFLDAGHILGSAMVRLMRGSKTILFSSDLGGGNSPLLPPHDKPPQAQYLVIESVYGDKVRPEAKQRRDELENVIEDAVARGGTLLIPAFSTERTQDLIFEVSTLMKERRIPSVPVYMDSPLAQKVTAAFSKYPQYFNSEVRGRVEKGEDVFSFPELKFIESIEESRRLALAPSPKIIIAGSGMSSGGRVQWHERVVLPDPKSTLLIVGYQAAGSVGRRLIEGQKTVLLHKEKVSVRCTVETLYSYSAHMDGEGLVQFVQSMSEGLKEVFVVHGEPLASAVLTQRVRDYLGIRAQAPELGEKAALDL